MISICNNPVTVYAKIPESCNCSAFEFLPEAVRNAELMRPQVATYGNLQECNLDPSVSVIPLQALVGRRFRLGPASRHSAAGLDRYFLTKLRGMKQRKSLASGSWSEERTENLLVCSRILAVCKKPVSWAHQLRERAARVVARLLPDRPDFLNTHHCFQGAKYECHA